MVITRARHFLEMNTDIKEKIHSFTFFFNKQNHFFISPQHGVFLLNQYNLEKWLQPYQNSFHFLSGVTISHKMKKIATRRCLKRT